MQCFSLVAERRVIAAPSFHYPMTFIAPELYPEATPGIRVSRKQRTIILDQKSCVRVSDELFTLKDKNQVEHSTDSSLILRASVRRDRDGTVTIVPERSRTEFGALALLDPGRGEYTSVRFGDDLEILARGCRKADVMFGVEEVALVAFPSFRAIPVYRTSRKWLCFGLTMDTETLKIGFNGNTINYQRDPLPRTDD